MTDLIHFDGSTLILGLFAAIGWLYQRRKKQDKTAEQTDQLIKLHSQNSRRIEKHEEECDRQRKENAEMLSEIKQTNAHLMTLTEAHGHSIDRLDREVADVRRVPRRG